MRYSKFVYQVILYFTILFPGIDLLFAQDSLKIKYSGNDSSEYHFFINKIELIGNQKTREKIILRELTFKEGDSFTDTLLKAAIEKSRINLLKLPLFNYVTINLIPTTDLLYDIQVIVEERWFLWPQLAIINNDRNFNTWLQGHDFSRLDYRFSLKQYNALGLNHIARAGISYGYTREYSFGYQNVALGKNQKHLVGSFFRFSQYKSFFYQTYQNKQQSFEGFTEDVLKNKYFRIEYFYRPGIKIHHKLYLSFQQVQISDSLLLANPNFLAKSKNENTFIEAQYNFTFDNRDSRSYPLEGNLLSFSMIKTGFNIPKSSEVDLLNFTFSVKQFYAIAEKFFGAHSFCLRKSLSGVQPYFYKVNLEYSDYIRGFEYYVIEGEDYYLSKNILKFELLPQTIKYLNFIPINKFKKIHYAMYLNAFFDMGFAHERNAEEILRNNLSDKVLYSFGLGFDLVTYYDKVLNLEYSINSLKEKGIFIHFIAPI